MTTIPWGLYLLAAGLSGLWAVVEVISAFEYAPLRALRTGGALLLIAINVGFAWLVLALLLEAAPDASASMWTAVAVAFGWQALMRTQINLLQPLPGSESEAIGVSINDLYARIQRFCRRQIDRSLAGERSALLEEALQLDLDTLIRRARLMAYALITDEPQDFDSYLQRMDERNLSPDERKLLVASWLLDNGGPEALRELLKNKGAGWPEAGVKVGEKESP
jgi:hypothetical protein